MLTSVIDDLKGKAKSMDCEMADRSVVASKSEPMKAGKIDSSYFHGKYNNIERVRCFDRETGESIETQRSETI